MTPRIAVRPAGPEDLALTYTITRQAMRGYIKKTWGRWDEAEQVRKHRELYTPETHRLIVVGPSAGATDAAGLGAAAGATTGATGEARRARSDARGQAAEEVAGLVATEPWPDDPHILWLVKLYLLARFRGQGIGSAVLRGVMSEAAALGQPLRLRVLRVNTRAQALYLAHGFRMFEESRERLFMEWRSPGPAPRPTQGP